jgi:Fe-S cluster biogenesis protein NfuA
MPWEDHEAREHVARTEQLLARLETLPDNAARAHAMEALQALVELYGECLDRVMGHAASASRGPATGDGEDIALMKALLSDELVSHLLLVHDLHPDSVESRVRQALEDVRPNLTAHGADAELLGLEGQVAQVRLHASGNSCQSSAARLELAVQEAVTRAAPEIAEVRVVAAEPPPSPQTLIPVADLFRGRPAAAR